MDPLTPHPADAPDPAPPSTADASPGAGASPPASGRWPADAHLRFYEAPSAEARAEVDRIREEALSLGWSEDQLYRNQDDVRFPSRGYGLVCFLKGRHVDRVTATSIRLVGEGGAAWRFYQVRGADHPAFSRVPVKASRRGGPRR